MIELVSLRVMLRELLVSMNFHVLHPFNTTQLNAFFALVITQMSITSLHVLHVRISRSIRCMGAYIGVYSQA